MPEVHFTQAPTHDDEFMVGDRVEVYCDHERNDERVRDWLEGVVVQVDPKMVAVQFQESVYLTDGWMVPDHVLWCPKTSSQIRSLKRKQRSRSKSK